MTKKLGGKYRIETKLGQGGTSAVYLAYDETIGRRVVLKAAAKEEAGWKEDAICREIDMLAALDCVGIPKILDCLEENDRKIMVMDYIEGENLGEYIERTGPMEEKRALTVFHELAGILEYLHLNGIIFLDLKPSNIMMAYKGGIKLIDFGSAVRKKEACGEFVRYGTYGFAAPELLEGKEVDERADIYSFGATGYYLLTGISPAKPPYKLMPVSDWNKALSKSTETILQNCMHREKELRYGNMEQICSDLSSGVKARPTAAGFIQEYFKRRGKVLLKQEKNIFCSDKRPAWMLRSVLLSVFISGLCTALNWNSPDITKLYAASPDSRLFVNVRNEIGQKLLIREGSIYYTKESIVFEIPVRELEPDIEYEVRILSKNIQSGHEKERKFQIVRQEDGKCTERIPE